MPFVYSTASANTTYIFYKTVKNGDKTIKRAIPASKGGSIVIKGGANVATPPHKSIVDPSGMPIHTPVAVRTEVTDRQLEMLRNNISFKRHEAAGFIKVDNKQTVEKAARSLQPKDKSAPLVPSDYTKKGHKVGKSKAGKDVEIELEVPALKKD